jgi:hypothetical protein
MYKLLTDEQKQIIIEKNLNYYYNNKEKIKERTKIYWKEYYKNNLTKMLERQKKNYRKQKYFINDNENINIKLKEREEIIVLFN